MFKIMIVEDDTVIRDNLCDMLSRWGFDVLCAEDFKDVLTEFSKFLPHLILMDINLPYFDGYYWCNRIRELSKAPIIFVSSRNSSMDIVMAVNMGGDDFIQKPFSIDVVMAKINALLRRTYSYSSDQTAVIEHNGVILNLGTSSVMYKSSKAELTKNELRILQILMRDNGNIVSRDKIMRYLWEDESFVDDSTLTVNINRLRKKLEDIGQGDLIQTKKGQGYIIL